MTSSPAGKGTSDPSLSLEDRIARGIQNGRVITDEIIPFPEKFEVGDLSVYLTSGPVKDEIFRLLNLGWKPTLFPYHSSAGLVVMNVLRLDNPELTEKFVRSLTVESMIGIRPNVRCRTLAPLRPLYGLHRLAANAASDVLIVEGEKAADAAKDLLPELIVTTWPNGAQSLLQVDWQPLTRRNIIIWPDNDAAGNTPRTASSALARVA